MGASDMVNEGSPPGPEPEMEDQPVPQDVVCIVVIGCHPASRRAIRVCVGDGTHTEQHVLDVMPGTQATAQIPMNQYIVLNQGKEVCTAPLIVDPRGNILVT